MPFISPFMKGSNPAFTGSCKQAVRALVLEQDQHFLLKGLPQLRGLNTKTLTWLPCRDVFSQQNDLLLHNSTHRLSPPQHGPATLPESTNEGLVRARTTIPQRLWWGRIKTCTALVSSNYIAVCTGQFRSHRVDTLSPMGLRKEITTLMLHMMFHGLEYL